VNEPASMSAPASLNCNNKEGRETRW